MNFFKTYLAATLMLALSIGMVSAQTFVLDTEASSVNWTGSKVIGGSHNGTVSLASGKLAFVDGNLSKGSFAADMTTIAVTDLAGRGAEKLSGHLFSKDFFDVEEFPTSTFFMTSIVKDTPNAYTVTGDLTIKGKTETVSFPGSLSWENEIPTAVATMKIDRTKFGIHYGSGSFFEDLGDKAISDEFELEIKLVGKR